MPFALIFIAVAMIIAGFRGTHRCLLSLVQQDASGQFVAWGGAVLVVGGLGYVKTLAPISTALIALLVVVLFLGNRGVFAQAATALQQSATTNVASTDTVIQPSSSNTATPRDLLAYGDQLLAGSGIGSNPGTGTGGIY